MKKNLILLCLSGSLLLGGLAPGAYAYASETDIPAEPAVTTDTANNTEDLNTAEEETMIAPDNDFTTVLIDSENTDSNTPWAEIEEETEGSDTSLSDKEELLIIRKDNFVADTFKGVKAVYRPGKNDGSNATYSCAAYIKKFYKEVYQVSVYNLFAGQAPKTYEGKKIASVKAPKAGDIAYANSHWAIVKSVDKENKKVVLIEQNWKWQQGGQTVCKINRVLSWDSLSFYRLSK